ncbi:MAG: FtsQ-type POTRA domain-containing protein [Ruminococcus sp.]|nr:FtsQ-type POTRA domain-containing protein [Ruminococcus sp.]
MTSKQIRIRRILIMSAILLAVIAIGVILSFTVLFKTENIIVEGCSYYYDDQIISYSNVSLQQNIFIAKMNSTPQDIIDNFAYVEDARVDFNIPDTITITITDAVPAYYMTEGNNYLLISAKGRVLERTETKPDGLPELICGEVTGKEVGEYIKFDDPSVPDLLNTVANSLSDNSFTGIVGFDVTDTTAITLDYEGRIKINVGVAEDLDYKLRTAQAIIDKKLDPNHTGQVYGNLDVSTCAKNKMSHYVPAATVPQATMATSGSVPSTTAPADGSGDGTDWGDYSDDLYGLYGVYNWEDNSDEWSDDNNTDWNDNNGEGGYDNGGYDGGGSQNNGYDGEVPEY